MISVIPDENGFEVVSEGDVGMILRELMIINIDVLKHIYIESPAHYALSYKNFVHEMMNSMIKDITTNIERGHA